MHQRLRFVCLLWIGLNLGCATAALAATATTEPAAPAASPAAKTAEVVTPPPEDTALKAAYLDLYSWKKFKTLLHLLPEKLPAEKVEQLRRILAKRETTLADSRVTATKLGMDPNTYIEQQIAAIKQEMIAALGAGVTDAFEDYLRTLPQRKSVWEINQPLIYDGHPMTPEQMEKLTRLISENEVRMKVVQPTPKEIDAYIGGKEESKNKIVQAAASFLSPLQVDEVRHELELQLNFLKWQRSRMPADAK